MKNELHRSCQTGRESLLRAAAKTLLQWMLVFFLPVPLHAQSSNEPSKEAIEEAIDALLIPRIELESVVGVEALEFMRLKVWENESFEGESVRMAFEFRCSPERLRIRVSVRASGILCRDALDLICRQLGITWKVEKEKILFMDPPVDETNAPPGGSAGGLCN